MSGADLRRTREAVVREHMDAENRRDFDAALATFKHPRYELIAAGVEFDGEADVRRYFALSRIPFPDQSNEIIALHHAENAVIAKFWLMGTHKGRMRGPSGEVIAPTGKKFRVRMAAVFEFEGAGLICERVYYDQASILRQLAG